MRAMLREGGQVISNLRRPWRDRTRGFVFNPLTFVGAWQQDPHRKDSPSPLR